MIDYCNMLKKIYFGVLGGLKSRRNGKNETFHKCHNKKKSMKTSTLRVLNYCQNIEQSHFHSFFHISQLFLEKILTKLKKICTEILLL